MPMSVQVKLLRVLEERQVWRVGSVRSRAIDVRFVAATNRDLDADIISGRFRQDLYFRLNGMTVHIPPLRERTEEIEDLARGFIADSCNHHNVPRPELSEEVSDLLLRYTWPGNIRELRNVIERAVILASDGVIRSEHLPLEKMTATISTRITPSTPPKPVTPVNTAAATIMPGPLETPVPTAFSEQNTSSPLTLGDRLKRDVQEVERQHIIDALSRCGGNQTRAAQELGISRRTLISRLETYGIPRPLKDRRP
jgi:DNA-binding NtrC family response regulator